MLFKFLSVTWDHQGGVWLALNQSATQQWAQTYRQRGAGWWDLKSISLLFKYLPPLQSPLCCTVAMETTKLFLPIFFNHWYIVLWHFGNACVSDGWFEVSRTTMGPLLILGLSLCAYVALVANCDQSEHSLTLAGLVWFISWFHDLQREGVLHQMVWTQQCPGLNLMDYMNFIEDACTCRVLTTICMTVTGGGKKTMHKVIW